MQLKIFMKKHKCLISIASTLLIIGIFLIITFPFIYNHIINNELVLVKDKHTYEVWKKNPIPLTLEFYFFNWTNPEDLENPDVKPRLEEVGPYKFKETKEKVNITWNENGTVTFRQLRYWYFDAENSNGSLEDEVTTLNPVAVVSSDNPYQYHLKFIVAY